MPELGGFNQILFSAGDTLSSLFTSWVITGLPGVPEWS